MKSRIVLFIIINLAALSLSGRSPSGDLTLNLSKRDVKVSEFFNGTIIEASGRSPSACDLIVQMASAGEPRNFLLKGNKGPFWVVIGKVRFENVPWMVAIRSTAPPPDLLAESELERLQIGRKGTLHRIRVAAGDRREPYLTELMRLKEKAGLFDFRGGGVELKRGGFYRCSFSLPAAISPGDYTVSAFAVRNQTVVKKAYAVFTVERSGLCAVLNRDSVKHPVLYGLIAVLMALLIGLLAGLLRGRAPGRPIGQNG